jgi:very-short-patch-repair endonuclease
MPVGKLQFRRKLRREQTDAERKLWSLLRSRQLEAYKFRRQHTIGPYIADFCCLERRLVIELDGGLHVVQVKRDEERTNLLKSKGFQVLRVWDHEVFKETDVVIGNILKVLEMIPITASARAKVYRWNAKHE